jgi:CRP-like cAMP-binding protein
MFDNPLLDSVPAELLQGRVNTLDFVKGDVLARPESPIERLIFPRSGLLSVVVELTDGAQIEAAMIGPGGALGGAAMFGAKRHVSTVVAQLSGRAWTLVLPNAFEVADRVPEFRAAILAQERYLLAQAQQTATCNAKHSTMERLCSWLLRARDEARRDELLMTQELLARMLGVQRASVSMLASQLQEKRLVQYRRGRLQIVDADGLAAHACECHKAVHTQRERLFSRSQAANEESSRGGAGRPSALSRPEN